MRDTQSPPDVVPVTHAFAATDRSVLSWEGVNYVPQPTPEVNAIKAMTLRIPTDTYERLREQAHTERTTITALILESIEYTHMWQTSGDRS